MRRATIAVMVLVSAVSVAQAPPAPDPMAKPVTLHLKMVTVREALKQLSKAGGLELGPRDALGDLKVTVLVRDEPVGSVMVRIADLFHADWSPTGPGRYDLSVPNAWRNAMEAYVDRENEDKRKAAEAQVKMLVAGAAIPYLQVLATLRGDTSSLTTEQKDTLQAVTSPEQYLLGSTFARMGQGDMTEFWNGRVVRASDTLPAGTQPNLPPNLPGPAIRRGGQPAMSRVVRAVAFYDPLTGKLETGNPGRGGLLRESNAKLIDHPYPTGPLAELAFGKAVLAWNRIEADSPRLQATVQAEMLRGTYYGGALPMADALAWLHDQTGVPIVADAFRVPVKLPRRGGTVANWLAGFQQENSAFVRTEGGFVEVRHGGFWRLRPMDAPEDSYASLESTTNPSLDQYATFAASLTGPQMLPFRIKGAAITKVDPAPLVDGMAALRFYASLSGDARRAALAGTPLNYVQLSASSQDLFIDALDNPVGGAPVGAGVPDRTSTNLLNQLGFLITPGAVIPTPPVPGAPPGPSSGFQMLFGTSPNAGVQYLIPLDH
jgi:hypothetical protein